MKKTSRIIAIIVLVLLLSVTSIVMFACGKEENTAQYTAEIQYINQGTEAISALKAGTAKFAVLGEPAATMAGTNANAIYRIDLQSEWKKATGFDGYPQASTIAKNDIIENHSAFLSKFLAEMQANVAWIVENASQINPILARYDSTSKFPSANIIQNCNIRFEAAANAKASVLKYLEIMSSFDKTFVGETLPNDAFFSSITPDRNAAIPAQAETKEIHVYVPDGAPALAIAKLLNESNFEGYSVTYTIVPGAQEISAAIANGSADIAILPTNLAAKLYGMGKPIKLVSSNVFGLLYLVGTEEIADFSKLDQQKILCTGQGGTPDFVLKYILSQNNVSIQ